jgi:peptidoglycan/LPS O-acetylase OafA/YrhL
MQNKLFFSGLNELRAFAALAVVFHHIELYKQRSGISSLYNVGIANNFIENLGKNGVYLFFVLSGFLITYLLLEEKSVTGKISVFKFYGRRILRIWPLYFIILSIGFFLLPFVYNTFPDFFEAQTIYNERIKNLVYGENILLFLFFLSNVALHFFGGVAGAAQSWSVSVEEQFYFIWPWIVKFFSDILWIVLLLIIIVMTAINYKINSFASFPYLQAFLSSFNIDFMSIGGIIAIIYRTYKAAVQKLITNKALITLITFSIVLHLLFDISHITLGLSFGLLILLFIENKIEIKLFSIVGKWSYGIYMYHPLVMYFSFSLVDQMHITSFIGANLAYYILIIGITILLSYFSYKYIELYFLKLKHKVSPIVSGNL